MKLIGVGARGEGELVHQHRDLGPSDDRQGGAAHDELPDPPFPGSGHCDHAYLVVVRGLDDGMGLIGADLLDQLLPQTRPRRPIAHRFGQFTLLGGPPPRPSIP